MAEKSVTFNQNRRSRSVGTTGHVQTESAVNGPEYAAGQLTARVYAMIGDTGADFASLAQDGPLLGYAADRLTVRAVKLFADGALSSRSAALLAPYSDRPDQHGLLFMSDAEIQHKIASALLPVTR